jgi:hypothetical protein
VVHGSLAYSRLVRLTCQKCTLVVPLWIGSKIELDLGTKQN